jgi:hypothetical protein
MKSVSFNRNTSKGFSLIELLLVLGVLAILLVAAFVVYPQVRDRNQANTEVSNLTTIKAGVNNLYAAKGGNYTGLTKGVANQARVFPASMNNGTYTTGQAITSSWGGDVDVAVNTAAQGSYAANRTFTISYTAVPSGVCLPLVSGAAGNFTSIRVGGTTGTGATAGTEVITSTGFSPTDAATACSSSANPSVAFISN